MEKADLGFTSTNRFAFQLEHKPQYPVCARMVWPDRKNHPVAFLLLDEIEIFDSKTFWITGRQRNPYFPGSNVPGSFGARKRACCDGNFFSSLKRGPCSG